MEIVSSPIKAPDRENFMDALRGFAILGIFIANLYGFSYCFAVEPGAEGTFFIQAWDQKMHFLHHMLIEGKFYSIFSFLFGWGMALQVMKLEEKGIKRVSLIRRRLVFMLLLGAFHLILWTGDIVFFYALLGFVLLQFRKLNARILLITGIVLVLSPILWYFLKMKFPFFNTPVEMLYKMGAIADKKLLDVDSDEGYKLFIRKASWCDLLKSNLSGFFYRFADLFFQSRIFKVLGMMLIGMAVGRSYFYKNVHQHKKTLFYIIGFGVLVALPANYILSKYMMVHDGSYNGLKMNGFYQTIAYAIGVAPLAATYIAVFMLLFQTAAGKKVLSMFEPVGKMAFSNYILQTVIGTVVFNFAGFGYMERMGQVYYTLFALIVFCGQIILSTIWLKNFNYGPLEWIWRSCTYGKWQIMRKLS